MKKIVPLDIAYRLIGPGPVVLVSSLLGGKAALTPIAWHMPVSDEPPVVAIEIWHEHFSHKAVLETGDFVINIPSSSLVDVVKKLGSVSGFKTDKFKEFGLTAEKSVKVKSPRLAQAIGVLECRLRKSQPMLKDFSVFIADVVHAEADDKSFTDRWCPESGGERIIQHLGGKIFAIPEKRTI